MSDARRSIYETDCHKVSRESLHMTGCSVERQENLLISEREEQSARALYRQFRRIDRSQMNSFREHLLRDVTPRAISASE